MMRRLLKLAVGAAVVGALIVPAIALAQTKKPAAAKAPAPTAQAAPAPAPGWVTQCAAVSRTSPLECRVEENAVMNNTGQLVVGFSIKVPSDTRAPVALIHLPLGLYIPGGLKLQVDGGQSLTYPLQTCDASGCFVGTPVDAGLLEQMKHGQQLKVTFQNLQRADIAVPLPLADFATSYAKIQ